MDSNHSILILGSSGYVGSSLLRYLSKNFIVLSDSDYALESLFQHEFFLDHNISFVVNCIGDHKTESHFFKSNFLLPLYVTNFLNQFSLAHSRFISLIHLSSVGITLPYTNITLDYSPSSPFSRSSVPLNLYEFSKLSYHTLLEYFNHNSYMSTYSLLLSNVVSQRSLSPLFTLCAILSPFRLDSCRLLPVTLFSDIYHNVEDIILSSQYTSTKHYTISVFSRQPITNYFPSFCFSIIKIPLPQHILFSTISFLRFQPFSRLYRFFVFLYLL